MKAGSMYRYIIICWIITFLWPGLSFAATARDKYLQAEVCYTKLLKSPQKQKYRHNWLACIDKFQDVYRHDPSGPWAAAGLYMSAKLYVELYQQSYKMSDKKEALDIYERIIKRFPRSKYRQRALQEIGSGSKTTTKAGVSIQTKKTEADTIAKIINKSSPVRSSAKESVIPSAGKNSIIVTGLRFWSNPSYTRVVIDADDETSYTHRLLKKDPLIQKPPRLFVDLNNSKLGKDIQNVIPINDNLLSDARAGQYTPDTVRVVVDIKSFETYKIFSLKNPFRIVIDVWGKSTEASRSSSPAGGTQDTKVTTSALARQFALGVSRIVIDPGHGGKDYGAPGYLKGVHEKDVVLKIGKQLAQKIREKLRCEVIMTRNSDRFLTLEERTAIANTNNADLFISIHTNSAQNRRASGIETYFLNLATDDDAILVAARENATSTKNIGDLQTILNDLMQNAKINESSRLAGHVQESLYQDMKKGYSGINNKGVKQAPFYVLLGAQMPAILIETSFISNPGECERLVNSKYQDSLCNAIVKGIEKYIKETNPTAFLKDSSRTKTDG